MNKMFKALANKVIPHTLAKRINEHRIERYNRKVIEDAKSKNPVEYEDYISEWYHERTKYLMDFDNPVTFTQKQQWLKLYDNSPEKTILSDKYRVRSVIKDILGTDAYLVPLISTNGKDHFDSADEINFKELPNAFVLKCNHGSGYNIVVQDKNQLTKKSIKRIKRTLNMWLKEEFAYKNGLELVYLNIKPTIIIEKYIAINGDLPDYKFLCFSGEIAYVWSDQGRYFDHRRTVFNPDYSIAPFNFHKYENVLQYDKPENYDKMLEIAKKLCGNYPYVRIDLYNVNGQIFFSEMTFSSSSGGELPNPIEYDRILGDLIKIDKSKRDNNHTYRMT